MRDTNQWNSALLLLTNSTNQIEWTEESFGPPKKATITSQDFNPHIAFI
jgi:hypothetical protein